MFSYFYKWNWKNYTKTKKFHEFSRIFPHDKNSWFFQDSSIPSDFQVFQVLWELQETHFTYITTWSCTSPSHNSRHSRFSKGLHRDSLKWKWGNSCSEERSVVTTSWIHCTAFLLMVLSLWHAACKSEREIAILYTLLMI